MTARTRIVLVGAVVFLAIAGLVTLLRATPQTRVRSASPGIAPQSAITPATAVEESPTQTVTVAKAATTPKPAANPPAPNEGWAQVWLLAGTIPIRSLSSEAVDGFNSFGTMSAGFRNGRTRMDKVEPGAYTLVAVSRPNNVDTDEEVDPFADAAWNTQFIEIKGEREISIQVGV